jgi:hypothetical protein
LFAVRLLDLDIEESKTFSLKNRDRNKERREQLQWRGAEDG